MARKQSPFLLHATNDHVIMGGDDDAALILKWGAGRNCKAHAMIGASESNVEWSGRKWRIREKRNKKSKCRNVVENNEKEAQFCFSFVLLTNQFQARRFAAARAQVSFANGSWGMILLWSCGVLRGTAAGENYKMEMMINKTETGNGL